MEGGGRNFIWGSAVGLEINNPWSRGVHIFRHMGGHNSVFIKKCLSF